MFWTTSSPAVG